LPHPFAGYFAKGWETPNTGHCISGTSLSK
jgi:hypothetical protein